MSIKNYLANVIGQKEAKNQINFYLDSYESTKLVPNFLFLGAKGDGKTLLAMETARNLVEFDEHGKPIEVENPTTKKMQIKKKPMLCINCGSLKSLDVFIEQYYLQYINGKNVTIFLDEIHAAPKSVLAALLTLLNPNAEHKNVFCHNDYVVEIDFRKHTFLLATTDPQKLPNPLKDKVKIIELSPYSLSDLAKIIQKNLPDVAFESTELLEEISSYARGNPRQAVSLATRDISAYLKGAKKFGRKQWDDFKKVLSLYPFGLTSLELNILKLLKAAVKTDGMNLTSLASQTGLERSALQRSHESWLIRNNLMTIGAQSHRQITPQGIEYLKALKL